ncbi:hypothetical protein BLOT_008369 [Blomia tropicalis]|nr:hypothetical protein BLOT_008369 [Blomia tropicalis]
MVKLNQSITAPTWPTSGQVNHFSIYGQSWYPYYYSQNYVPITYGRTYSPYVGFCNSPAMMLALSSGPSSFDGCSNAQVLSPRNQRSEWQPISENKDVSNKSASNTSNNV